MIQRKYMRTRQLKPGMVIDQSVEDRMGRNLVVKGSVLDDYIIESLLKLGVMSVYIQDGEYDPDKVAASRNACLEKMKALKEGSKGGRTK